MVVSIDPRRRWVADAASAEGHALVDHTDAPDRGLRGPAGETLAWYECTVQVRVLAAGYTPTVTGRYCPLPSVTETLAWYECRAGARGRAST